MVKGKPRKLRVYEAQFGFYDTVVAAPNRTAARRAWGIHQDIFADGGAREATDQAAIAAALAHPETPLRRGIGTGDPFDLHPNLPRLPDRPQATPRTARLLQASASHPAKPAPPDRSALSAAEAALTVLDEQRRQEVEDLRRRRAALDAEDAEAARRDTAARSQADAALERERKAFVRAGGRPDRLGH